MWNDDILVSHFGKKTEALWISAHDGEIVNVTSGATLVSGLYHPHSLLATEDRVIHLESQDRRVRVIGAAA